MKQQQYEFLWTTEDGRGVQPFDPGPHVPRPRTHREARSLAQELANDTGFPVWVRRVERLKVDAMGIEVPAVPAWK